MRAFSPFALVMFLALCGCKASPSPQADATNSAEGAPLPTISLRVATTEGAKSLIMEVAVSEQEQEQGLMHRTALRSGHGMLFPFTLPRTASFWMKDTPLPLDLLFVRPDGTIAAIVQGKSNDLHPLSAGEPVSAVVEIGSGEAQRMGIATGDSVQWGDCREGRQTPGAPINPLAFCPAAP